MLVELQPPTAQVPNSSPSKGNGRDIPSRKGKDRSRDSEESLEWAIDLHEARTGYTTKERWMNLAPLRDFCVVKDEGGGMVRLSARTDTSVDVQSHLVTASGAASSNSLRIIRSGVGLEDRLSIQGFSEVTALFPLASQLLVSTRTSTTLLQIRPEIHVVPVPDTLSATPTLAASSVTDSLFLHAGSGAVTLLSTEGEVAVKSLWRTSEGQEVVTASISGDLVVAAKRGGEVAILQWGSDDIKELWWAAY
jgi:DNA damage-binding protein 1